MRLNDAKICCKCDEIFSSEKCPRCKANDSIYICRWLPSVRVSKPGKYVPPTKEALKWVGR
jgi:hypothetical protein